MLIEFNCNYIKKSFKNDANNFAGKGICNMNFEEKINLMNLSFKKSKEKIYFDNLQNYVEFDHSVTELFKNL